MIAGQIEIQMMANIARLVDDMGKANNVVGKSMKSIENSVISAKSILGTLGIGLSAGYFISLMEKNVSAATDFENAMRGLASVARYSGADISSTLAMSTKLTTDGLLSTTEAATALKNLLLRGFSTDEAVQMILRFKDSAAFGRQASLDFGQAVVTATEGLKNENSILVDNAGVTKNVSVMHQEYANSIGKAVTSLTLAEKRHAEYNGILHETEAQIGNAALMADGYQGALARMHKEVKDGSIAIGQQLTPALAEIIKGMNSATEGTTAFYNIGAAVSTIIETLAVLGGNVAYVFKEVGNEIGGMAAQLVSLATLDFKGFSAIGDAMKKDATESRAALDKWEQDILTARDRVNAELKKNPVNIGADTGARRKDDPIKADPKIEKEAQRIREALAALQDKTFDDWIAANQKLQDAKDQASLTDEQRIGYQWSKELENIEERKTRLQDYGMWSVEREKEYGEAKVAAAAVASQGMITLAKQEAAAKQAILQGALGSISSLMSSKNAELFAIGKAASIANATISTIEGATKALSYGPIIGPPLAALVWAAGLANVAAIAATQIGGGAASPTNATLGGGGSPTPTPVYGGNPGGPSTPAIQNNDQPTVTATTHLTIDARGSDVSFVKRIEDLMPSFIAANKNAVAGAVNAVLNQKGRSL